MYIKVRVTPGAKKEAVKQVSEDTWEIKVKERAERNMVNTRLKIILGDLFHITPKQVRLVSGPRSPSKIFSLPDET